MPAPAIFAAPSSSRAEMNSTTKLPAGAMTRPMACPGPAIFSIISRCSSLNSWPCICS